tara:strand:+ start:21 stop:233 length:213 start_codon:yes stop_codon:yes gene_type:complete
MSSNKIVQFPSKETFNVSFEIDLPQKVNIGDSDIHLSIEGSFCQAIVQAHTITEARNKIEKCFENIEWLD